MSAAGKQPSIGLADLGAGGEVHHFIDGESVPSLDGRTFPTENPATGETIAAVAFGSERDVDRAVRAARRAFEDKTWSGLAPAERARRLRRVGGLLEDHCAALARLECDDAGKPLTACEADVAAARELLDFYSTLPVSVKGTVYADVPGFLTHSRREPYGVVGAIAPWNYPLLNAVFRTGAALAVGNSVVFKMAEQTPLTTSAYARLCHEAGVPAGALNVVHGDGPTTGHALVAHPGVPKLTFAGSTEVGKEILRASAAHAKSCQLEMGGKSPSIVLRDAELDAAIPGVLYSAYTNSGQVCTSGSRLLVAAEVAEEVVDRLVDEIGAMRVGDPRDAATQLGPLVSDEQRGRVEHYVEAGAAEGAAVVVGGRRAAVDGLPDGYFFEPTLFERVRPGMRIAQEEIFGPVLSVLTFDGIDEAIAVANDSSYGLAATVWTNDLDHALAFTERLESGIVWVNCPDHEVWHASYVGRKQSGLGEDLGTEVIRAFTRLKLAYMAGGRR